MLTLHVTHYRQSSHLHNQEPQTEKNNIPLSPYGNNNEFRPIYLESKFPACMARHVRKNL